MVLVLVKYLQGAILQQQMVSKYQRSKGLKTFQKIFLLLFDMF